MEKIEVTMPLYEIRLCVTGACNQRCVYCGPFSDGRGNNGYGELTITQIDEVLPLLKQNNLHVQLTGGEPTIRLDLVAILEKLKKGGLVDIGLTTNGSMLDVGYVAKLVKAGVTDIHIHVPSLNEEIFQQTTGNTNRGVVEKIKHAGIFLAQGYCRVEFNTPVTRLNEETLDALCEFCFANRINLKLIEEVNIENRHVGLNEIIGRLEKWLIEKGIQSEPEKASKRYGNIYNFGDFCFRIAPATSGLVEYLIEKDGLVLYDGRYWLGGNSGRFIFSPSCFLRPQIGDLHQLTDNFNDVKDFYENNKK